MKQHLSGIWMVLLSIALVWSCFAISSVVDAKTKQVTQPAQAKKLQKSSKSWRVYKKKKGKVINLDRLTIDGVNKLPQRFYFHRSNYKQGQNKLEPKHLLKKVVGAVKKQPF